MKVLVIGANGQIGKRIISKLKDTNHQAIAMIRDENQKAELQAKGAETVVADLEGDLSAAFEKQPDAVIFTAGSGGHTPVEKTRAVDLNGAKKTIDEAVKHKVNRYIMVSALGANMADEMPKNMHHYFTAKSEADQYLVQSDLNYTIFRPGALTNEAGSGSIKAAEALSDYSDRKVSRDNVANAVVAALDRQNLVEKSVEILDGDMPIGDALAKI